MTRWGGPTHRTYTVGVLVLLASLDNAAIAAVPPLYGVLARELERSLAEIGLVTALTILIAAATAVGWGFLSDRGSRKRLLTLGTAIWASATILVALSESYWQFLALELTAAVGFGCVAAVGFSVALDFVTPSRRGLVMSLWGIAQGAGAGIGLFLGGLLGADQWRLPFAIIGGAGILALIAYRFSYEPERGRTEPEIARAVARGADYEYRATAGDLIRLATRRTNRWLILQGLAAQTAYGSLLWLPTLFASRVIAEGHSMAAATAAGAVFGVVFQIGGIFSILGGHLGDRLQRTHPRGRALLSAVAVAAAIPFFIVLFLLPMRGLEVPASGDSWQVVVATLKGTLTNPWLALAFLVALMALALTSLDSPNYMAMIGDVNLPEHRGTVFGMGTLANGLGRAGGNFLAGAVFGVLAARLESPANVAIGLIAFQTFFLVTAFCYYRASLFVSRDAQRVRRTLERRTFETARVRPVATGTRVAATTVVT